MDYNNLKSGTCPQCGSKEIYTDSQQPNRGERSQIPVSSFKWLLTKYYVCISCGYFEEYIREKELKDEKTIAKIKDNWKKV
jgi:C4-type Zn-finger protein